MNVTVFIWFCLWMYGIEIKLFPFLWFGLSRPVYFQALGIECTLLKAPFMLLLPDFMLFGGGVSGFGVPTIDLCDKFCHFSVKTAADLRLWKTCFGWLPLMQDPFNINLTRALTWALTRMWLFSLATAFSNCMSSVVVEFLCKFSTMSSKWNR